MQLYIHIGTNKTGTSSIQHFLNKHRKELNRHGVLYPKTGCPGEAHYEISRTLGFDHEKQPISEAERNAFLARFKAEVEESRCEKCVISSEIFVLPRRVESVREFFSDFDCRIVVYFRRHDHWWLSAYNQAVKTVVQPPWAIGFEGFLDFHRQKNRQFGNYRSLLDRWEKAFGRENIIVRPYEKEQNRPDIIADFLSAIGCGELYPRFSNAGVPVVNRSLDASSVFMIDLIQRMKIDAETRRILINHVMQQGSQPADVHPVPPALRRKLVDERGDDYAFIARTYLNRPDGALFREPLPDPEAEWKRPGNPSRVEVAEIVAQALAAR